MSRFKSKLDHYSLVWSGSLENGVATQLFSPSGQHLKLRGEEPCMKEHYLGSIPIEHSIGNALTEAFSTEIGTEIVAHLPRLHNNEVLP
ncbi:hypothetical protein AVEN_147566-1 [Araneus ventricosus]|uniref:Uncharacterized protein n=1 Tax=Araneus ventricosus TaxID=182803 RepID=A0A4Y2QXX4_ARAVE|nr:hypothetical protein AVEN_147566-1 [Araneus ventricosus]